MTDTENMTETAVSMAFGDTESAIDATQITDYTGVFVDQWQDFYTPPISLLGLTQLLRANPVHGTLPFAIANQLTRDYEPNALLPLTELRKLVIDYRTMGNCYLQLRRNVFGEVVGLQHLPAINMRRMPDGRYCLLLPNVEKLVFELGQVWHLADYDPQQQIYGVPYWIGAMTSIMLGEQTDLFPLKFFRNGAHAGNLFVTSGLLGKEVEALMGVLLGTKGAGNFRSGYVNLPNGEVDKVLKVIPIGEVASKVEFSRLASASDKRILSAWQIRPELVGMMPETNGGSGDLEKILGMHFDHNIIPLQQEFQTLNALLPARHGLLFRDRVVQPTTI